MAVIQMNFLSRCLGMQTNVTICLPSYSFKDKAEGREEAYVPGMKYQVLWLLHGSTGDDSDYLRFTNIARYADEHKLAVVMPAGYNSCYANDPDGARYMDYVGEELPEVLRALLPFSEKREDNFIGGLSMGCHGVHWLSLHYPQNYAAALAMSGGDIYNADTWIRKEKPKTPVAIHWDFMPAEARALAEEIAAKKAPFPKFYATWGDKDPHAKDFEEADRFLKGLGFDFYEEIVPGYAHEWDFWDLTLRKALSEWLPIRHSVIWPE